MHKRVRCWCVVLGLVAAVSVRLSHALVVRDDRQMDVVISKPVQRVVSLLPSLTESVCALGSCSRLVGVDRYSNWPESIAKLPRLGGGIDPQIERIVALKPDLVLMAVSARGAERLQALGVTVLVLEPRTHADIQRVLQTIAKALAIPLEKADTLWRGIESGIQDQAKTLPSDAQGQRVYFEVGPTPYAASESSFIGETLQKLGARNIVSANLGTFPKINPEMVVRAQPDIIMVGDSHFSEMTARPGWRSLQAIRANKVCQFTPIQSDLLVRPGPRIVEAAKLMAQCMQDKALLAVEKQP